MLKSPMTAYGINKYILSGLIHEFSVRSIIEHELTIDFYCVLCSAETDRTEIENLLLELKWLQRNILPTFWLSSFKLLSYCSFPPNCAFHFLSNAFYFKFKKPKWMYQSTTSSHSHRISQQLYIQKQEIKFVLLLALIGCTALRIQFHLIRFFLDHSNLSEMAVKSTDS